MGFQSFPVPGKLYFKKGSLPIALRELKDVYHKNRVLIVTDEEMLHNGGISPVTGALFELGIGYAVNHQHYDADCVICCGTARTWETLPDGIPAILIPTTFDMTGMQQWLHAEMVILDEDMLHDDTPVSEVKHRILKAAQESLRGENASDYTLAWAVQTMHLLRKDAPSRSTLLHAMALAGLAQAAGEPSSTETDLFADAAQALGVSEQALRNANP